MVEVALLTVRDGIGGGYRYMKEMYSLMKDNDYGIKIINMPIKNLPLLGSGLTFPIATLLKNFNNYSIVHNLGTYPFFPLLGREPILLTTVHEFQALLYPDLNKIQDRRLKDFLWHYLVVNPGIAGIFNSDFVIASSIQTKEEAIKLGISRHKVFLATLGIDRRFLKGGMRQKQGKGFKIGFIGTLSPRKNTPFLINTFKYIESKNFSLELWGKRLYSSSEMASMINGDIRIHVNGPVSEERLVSTYDSFDVFAFLSIYEGCGLPILEAKARGLPVILYKKGHISREIKKYCFEVGTEEEMADLLLKLKGNGYNEKLRRKAMRDARSYTWERTAEKTLEAYLKIA